MTAPVVLDGEGFPHEYAAEVPGLYFGDAEPRVLIGISAHGGGTPGIAYANNGWSYTVLVNGSPLISDDDIHSGGMGKTHAEMARVLCDFMSTEEYADQFHGPAREFLDSERERLSMFGVEES
jgi:hypothetical protein